MRPLSARVHLLIVWVVSTYQATTYANGFLLSRWQILRRNKVSAFAQPADRTTTTSRTDTTVVVPRYFSGEVRDGTYPSPLHNIHVVSVLSDEEAQTCQRIATEYAAKTGCWDKPDFDRHASYATCDFPILHNENPLAMYLDEIGFDEKILSLLSERYGIPQEDLAYLDHFCSHYRAQTTSSNDDDATKDRLEAHRDGSILSFTVLLSPPDEFAGGGTFFDAMIGVDLTDVEGIKFGSDNGVIRPIRAGDACLHSGKLLHGADVVTSGERTVLVGFVDVADWWLRPGALSEACKNWGRMDVATQRFNVQQARTKNGSQRGWFLENKPWLPARRGPSFVGGFCPAFPSVVKRADADYQRRKKLEAEDILLRTIFATDRIQEEHDLFDGDVTVL